MCRRRRMRGISESEALEDTEISKSTFRNPKSKFLLQQLRDYNPFLKHHVVIARLFCTLVVLMGSCSWACRVCV